jgi:hypothetical protein
MVVFADELHRRFRPWTRECVLRLRLRRRPRVRTVDQVAVGPSAFRVARKPLRIAGRLLLGRTETAGVA